MCVLYKATNEFIVKNTLLINIYVILSRFAGLQSYYVDIKEWIKIKMFFEERFI